MADARTKLKAALLMLQRREERIVTLERALIRVRILHTPERTPTHGLSDHCLCGEKAPCVTSRALIESGI